VAHFHFVLSLGAVIGVFLSIFLVFPYAYNLVVKSSIQGHSLLLFVFGSFGVFFLMHFLGWFGLPRHYLVFSFSNYIYSFLAFFSIILITISILLLTLNLKLIKLINISWDYTKQLSFILTYFKRLIYFPGALYL
jgi:cytochrome c oxidase subunit 1